MPRLPLASVDDLREEYAAVNVALDRVARARPVSVRAALRAVEQHGDLTRWRRDLAQQLLEDDRE